jgi:hypothetical protein
MYVYALPPVTKSLFLGALEALMSKGELLPQGNTVMIIYGESWQLPLGYK